MVWLRHADETAPRVETQPQFTPPSRDTSQKLSPPFLKALRKQPLRRELNAGAEVLAVVRSEMAWLRTIDLHIELDDTFTF
ncbi:hypothetical protein Rleg4DRAFT_6921 [Rhizobium leguminosarum bv. trifolii WSM2297]|uniref:Uncharacterized protein n=1 Tax=Rhizobium leguminosarum bv. trifolii WSM2297 TaxID=754762 RepID=J0WHX3_RHILT|nr:hypothetical protein Rleg4DRAFT_5099 [Rhizobium leguminosarum bv. trifolii WSM2297]EJC85063.1 hypothetical protein Rleg4DRAFT_6921 [Rhizobium leguminosarum bv. trifolii WSM2297]